MSEQRSLFDGPTAAGQQGIDRAGQRAEREAPGWTEEAASALRDYAETVSDFTIEEARADVTARVGEPDELRAWGAVTQFARRRGWIRNTGNYRSAKSSNGSPKAVYEKGNEND